ncbi:PAS domain S-box protein [Haloarcula sp. CBA1130]|uniref:PAS domain S-box protein n=1 Tax=unclassified Haloarcula TaxID=2624677 RepID=UPI001247201A|nr:MULTISPECIES: PAS domain S-box protein [unclassified Haloarcula]KAA9398632.1 PAS domain S-box protein [Haloarcula sp. CBA1129]KAA9403149.1 PAS domain S-box protein [Haloarcula sp. CBA1130]
MADIQLLLAGDGNREALAAVVAEHHTPVTDTEFREADLHIVDESSFPKYKSAIDQYKQRSDPVFCPVILIRREKTPVRVDLPDIDAAEQPLVVNDIVTAPVDTQALFRTIANLLARRSHTEDLVEDLREQNSELRRFRNAVEHAGHAILITNVNGVIEYVNPAFEELTGFSADEAIGRTPRILKSGEQGEQFYERLWDTICRGDVWTSEIVNERKSGERFIINQTIAPIQDEDGTIQGFVGMQDEITGRRLREQQLTVFHRILRHNLRNNGTTISGRADILSELVDDDDALDHLETIKANVQSLLDISEKAHHVQELLADSLTDNVERELGDALSDITEGLAAAYPDGEFVVESDPVSSVSIDAKVIPAMQELIENGIKHSDASAPRVTIQTERHDSTATVTIADNGPGVPDRERRVIEAADEKPLEHGSGLGLWFAYWLISYVGGDIDIQTDADGTSVAVTVPVR